MTTSFKVFRAFNDPALAPLTGKRNRLDSRIDEVLDKDFLPHRLVRALAARRAIMVKEVFESFEFFERVRKRVRAPVVADFCCGHGLTGLLFAVFEPVVEQVLLVDIVKPPCFARVLAAISDVAPWAADKVDYQQRRVAGLVGHLPANASVVAIHACGVRTDRSIDAAIAARGSLAVVPCCYAQTAKHTPKALQRALGKELTTDIDRTYRLEAANYHVSWSSLPEPITPMNRIIVGRPA